MFSEDPSRHPALVLSDLAAAGGVLAMMMSWLPPIAGVLSITWFMIQIWESNTVQKALIGWRTRRQHRLLAILRAKEKLIAARIVAISVQAQSLDTPEGPASQDHGSDKT